MTMGKMSYGTAVLSAEKYLEVEDNTEKVEEVWKNPDGSWSMLTSELRVILIPQLK